MMTPKVEVGPVELTGRAEAVSWLRRFARAWARFAPWNARSMILRERKTADALARAEHEDMRYLERFYLTPRLLSECLRGVGVFLHCLWAPDAEGLHDHPWWFVSIVLRGWYVEETFHGVRLRGPGSIAFRSKDTFHRITAISAPGNVWTLVFHGPRRAERWGFLTPDAAKGYTLWGKDPLPFWRAVKAAMEERW